MGAGNQTHLQHAGVGQQQGRYLGHPPQLAYRVDAGPWSIQQPPPLIDWRYDNDGSPVASSLHRLQAQPPYYVAEVHHSNRLSARNRPHITNSSTSGPYVSNLYRLNEGKPTAALPSDKWIPFSVASTNRTSRRPELYISAHADGFHNLHSPIPTVSKMHHLKHPQTLQQHRTSAADRAQHFFTFPPTTRNDTVLEAPFLPSPTVSNPVEELPPSAPSPRSLAGKLSDQCPLLMFGILTRHAQTTTSLFGKCSKALSYTTRSLIST